MAIVSYMGHDLRMVEASCNGLMEALEADRFGPEAAAEAACSMRRDAWPTRPPFCATAPFGSANMSELAFPVVGFPFTVPRTLLSNLADEGEAEDEESAADPLSLAAVVVAVAIVAVTDGSLDEREDEKSTDGRQVELDVDPVVAAAPPPPLEEPFK